MINYGMAKEHHPKSEEIYRFISEIDFQHGDFFAFKSGGDGDNGEFLMDLLDCYFQSKQRNILLRCEDNEEYDMQ